MLSPKSDPKFESGSAIAYPKRKKLNIVNKILTNGPILTKRVALRRGALVECTAAKVLTWTRTVMSIRDAELLKFPGLNPGPTFSPPFQQRMLYPFNARGRAH